MTFDRFFRRRRPRRGTGHLANAVAGIAAGAGLMYFLDPGRGARRRAGLAKRAGRVLHDVEATVEAGARDLQHRAAGLAHEARARAGEDAVSEDVLAERVRAKLGRVTSHARAVRVAVQGGRVTLSGAVYSAEHGRVVRSVRLVRGVRSVEDRLDARESAEGAPALRGGAPPPGPHPEPLQRRWAPGTRLLAGTAGAVLAARALLARGPGRIPAGVAGAALLGKVMGGSGAARRGVRRVAHDASLAATRATERRKEGEAHRGAWHPEPEVREGKSPAELEPGIAGASPEPASGGRGSRGGEARRHRGRRLDAAAGAEANAPAPGTEEIASRADYLAPAEGEGVREGDLGATPSPEDAAAEAEAERGGPHPRGAWREPGDDES